MDEKKICENCKYFNAHYVRTVGGTFMKICCGHCICHDMDRNLAKKTYKQGLPCDKWEPFEKQIHERREGIIKVLQYMEEHLRKIEMCLQYDSDVLNGNQDN